MSYHTCVWIDHREARIFHITAKAVETTHIRDHGPAHHLHRKADHVGLGKVGMGEAFLADVSAALGQSKAILIMGPGTAKTDFKHHLDAKHPDIARNVWDVRTADHPTDGQIVAEARTYFHAEDRMR